MGATPCERRAQVGTAARASPDSEGLAQLLARAEAGQAGALATIVEVCGPMVAAVAARNLHSRDDIEDVGQDVWLTLAQNLGRIDDPRALRGWLVTVTTRAAWRHRRHDRDLVPMPDTEVIRAEDDTEADATRALHAQEVEAGLHTALDRLRPEESRLLRLLTANDRPEYGAVSRATGRPIGSIGPTRQRALARLRRDPVLRGLAAAVPCAPSESAEVT